MRLFTGITIPDKIISAAAELADENSHVQTINWTRAANLHVTTCFYGEIQRQHLGEFSEKMDEISKHQRAFTLKPESFTAFPEDKPYMIWLRFKKSKPFVDLCDALADISGKAEEKFHIPHVTLARFKSHLSARHLKLDKPVNDLSIPVREFHLYESILLPNGPEYRKIRTFSL